MFPVENGGKAKEAPRCMTIDEDKELIISGGVTTSEQYGKLLDLHLELNGTQVINGMGFVYALDMKGNWKWGKYFKTFEGNTWSYITDLDTC